MAKNTDEILRSFPPTHGIKDNVYTDVDGDEFPNYGVCCPECLFNYGFGNCLKLYESGVTDRSARINKDVEVVNTNYCEWFTLRLYVEDSVQKEVHDIARKLNFPPKAERGESQTSRCVTPKKESSAFPKTVLITLALILGAWLWLNS